MTAALFWSFAWRGIVLALAWIDCRYTGRYWLHGWRQRTGAHPVWRYWLILAIMAGEVGLILGFGFQVISLAWTQLIL